MVDPQAASFLIADVAALTGVPVPQLRSWERAGLLHPARSARGVRVYGAEDVARARLIKRSLVNPGRRGSLRRLAQRLASGELRPVPSDYAGLDGDRPAAGDVLPGVGWQEVLDGMADFVAIGDRAGAVAYVNPALRAALGLGSDALPGPEDAGPAAALFAADGLSLRWTMRTGVPQRDLRAVFRHVDHTERHTLWQVDPLPGRGGRPTGAVAVGRDVTAERAQAQAQEDQLAAAAHDLRSPVTTVLAHLQLARRVLAAAAGGVGAPASGAPSAAAPGAALDVPRLARHLVMAESGTRDLLRLLETLLDASAAAAGVLARGLDPSAVDLVGVARQAVEHARLLTARHRVVADLPADPVVVVGDRDRLREVLDNLLGNAVKYSPDGGRIEVALAVVDDLPRADGAPGIAGAHGWALIRVADEGLGIPAAEVPRVFDRYWRSAGPTRAVRGTGLGLYASRAIVAAHGGHVWVERTAVADDASRADAGWHGTVMAVALPLAAREER